LSAHTSTRVFRAAAPIAFGLWLSLAFCPAAFAADGPQAAAAAKEAAAKLQAYLRDLKKSKGQPDYSKLPASEYLKRIFDADALAALPPLREFNGMALVCHHCYAALKRRHMHTAG
jgi:hypothetical protein